MAKGKYEEWLTDEGLTLLKGWARQGQRDVDIARHIGINVATLYGWKNRFPEIDGALKKGKEVVDFAVENALLNKALGGDTTAMIFWLKNRMPKHWRDRPEAAKEVDDKLHEFLRNIKDEAAVK